jgi:hypothetical protein
MIRRNMFIFDEKRMSIILADAGATSTTWVVINNSQEKLIHTSGINPAINNDSQIEAILFDELKPHIHSTTVKKILFYGAGCLDHSRALRMDKILRTAFNTAEIIIKTDIEAAGISAFGVAKGIVVISGTGSSTGLMDGGTLVDVMPSKAYPEGDYASGAHIGALIVRDYNEGSIPIEIKKELISRNKVSLDELFVLFQDSKQSKMIASRVLAYVVTAPLFKLAIHKEYVRGLVNESLNLFYEQLKGHYTSNLATHSLSFVGGTVFTFKDEFRQFFQHKGVQINRIIRTPIKGLIDFHKNQ